MAINDLFLNRMTEPNPVLDPLLTPQNFNRREVGRFAAASSWSRGFAV
jgi:hypothetical protein